MAEICDRQGLTADAAHMWDRFLHIALDMNSNRSSGCSYTSYAESWAIQFQRLFEMLDLDGDIPNATDNLRRNLSQANAFPETLPSVKALRPHYRLAILSNADDDFLFPCLRRNQLEFHPVVSSERADAAKPNPAIFHLLSKDLSLLPKNILYVGDNPLLDVQGASEAGLQVAWVNRNNMRRPATVQSPEIMVSSLSELLPIVMPPQAA